MPEIDSRRAAEVALVREVIESDYPYSPQERAEQVIDALSEYNASYPAAPAPSGTHDYRPLDPARLYCRSCGRVIGTGITQGVIP